MRVFEHIGNDVQPVGLGAVLICWGAVALGVAGSAITSPVRAYVLAAALLLSLVGFPQRFVRVGLPAPFVRDDRGPAFVTLTWTSLVSTALSFAVGALGHAQLSRHGITVMPVVLSAAGAVVSVGLTLLVAHRTRGVAELALRYH